MRPAGSGVAHEHIYRDQVPVLVQLGLLDAGALPVVGAESARKMLDPSLPANADPALPVRGIGRLGTPALSP